MRNLKPQQRKKKASMDPMLLRYDPRYDSISHWPQTISGDDGPVSCVHCKGQTNLSCPKCKVALCCHYMRNCFLLYHTEYKGKIICLPDFLPPLVPSLDFSTSESDPSDSKIDLDDPESDLPDLQSDPGNPESTQENIENTQEEGNSFF